MFNVMVKASGARIDLTGSTVFDKFVIFVMPRSALWCRGAAEHILT